MAEKIIKEVRVYELERYEDLYREVYHSLRGCVLYSLSDGNLYGSLRTFILDFSDSLNLSETGVFPNTTFSRPKRVHAKLVGSVPVGMSFYSLYEKSNEEYQISSFSFGVLRFTESAGISSILPDKERWYVGAKVDAVSKYILNKVLSGE